MSAHRSTSRASAGRGGSRSPRRCAFRIQQEGTFLEQTCTAAKSWPPAGESLDAATRLALYRSQLQIRLVEKRAYDLFLQNLIKGTSHLAIGQEAIAAGFATAMKRGDWSFCTYRGHAHTLARGASMTGVL